MAQDPANAAAVEADVYNAEDDAEDAAATAAGLITGVTANAGLDTNEAATAAGHDAADAAEDAALTVVQAEIDQQELAYDAALTTAETTLEAVSTTDVAGSLKALVDTYTEKVTAMEDAGDALTAAHDNTTAKEAAAELALDTDLNTATKTYTMDVVVSDVGEVTISDNVAATGGTEQDFAAVYVISYDAATNEWTYSDDNGTTEMTSAGFAADTLLQSILAEDSTAALLTAAAAEAEADAALTAAEEEVESAAAAIETVDGALTDAGTAATATSATVLSGAAADYATAVANIAVFDEAVADFEEAMADVTAARADSAATAALSEAAADASDAITDDVADGGLGVTLGTWAASDDTASEVYVFDADVANNTLPSFGQDLEDQIFFGTGYSLEELAEDADLANENLGDVAALEIFWEETATALVLYVETETFAGNSASGANGDITTITLNGVTAADVSLDNGYLSATIA